MTDDDLIARLEKATGPNYALECEIAIAVGAPGDGAPKPYTASLDAALTLLGDSPEYEITTLYGVARVGVNLNHGEDGSPSYGERQDGNVPIALCIAALKARRP